MFLKFLGDVKGFFNTFTIIDFILSFIYVIMGAIFFAIPSLNSILVSILTGVILILNGALYIYSYINKDNIDLFKYNIIYGICLILVGILAFFLRKILYIIVGIYLIIISAQKVHYGIILKKLNESSWLLILVIGILYFVTSIITFFANNDNQNEVIGIVLFGYGLINFVNTLLLRRRSNYFLESKTDV